MTSMPCAFQIACWLSVLPPEQTMPSTERKTSSQLRGCDVLAMKLFWCEGSTLTGAQLRYHADHAIGGIRRRLSAGRAAWAAACRSVAPCNG
jgi:hypothetical protein